MNLSSRVSLSFGTPGSGKTSAILDGLRALTESATASSTLVVVPNRRSANLLRDAALRASGWVSGSDLVRTIQSIAFEICIAQAQSRSQPEPKLLTGAAQAALLQQILGSEFGASLRTQWGLPTLTLDLPSFIAELRDLIAVCQQHQTDPAQLIEIGRSGQRGAMVAAGRLLDEYRRVLNSDGLIDPQSLISLAVEAIEGQPELVPALTHLFIDDAQEFSVSELRLLAMLGRNAQISAYADPDATVLGFRAAAPDEIQRVLGEGVPLNRKDLPANSNRPRELAEALDRISQRIPTALAGTHRSSLKTSFIEGDSRALHLQIFDSMAAEGDYLADLIRQRRLQLGLSWSDFAVVVRTRVQIDQISHALSQHGVPVNVPTAQTALTSFGVAQHIIPLILRAQNIQRLDREVLDALLGSRLSQLDSIDIRALKRRLGVEPDGLVAAFEQLMFGDGFEEIKGPAATKARSYGALIKLATTADSKSPHRLISELWGELRIAGRLKKEAALLSEVGFAAQRDLDSIVELTNAAIRFSEQNPDSSALAFAQHQSQLLVAEDSLSQQSRLSAVQILTPAGLMAQRFPIVILPRLQEGIWPNLRPRNSLLAAASVEAFFRGASDNPFAPTRSELHHELRLFYKSVGAADSELHLSAVQLDDESPSQFLNLLSLELPNPISYRREHDIRAKVAQARYQFASHGAASAAAKLAAFAHLGAPGAHPQTWYGTKIYSSATAIATADTGPTVSPSQLEKFSVCPLHWFISSYGGDGKGFEASVGTLLHEALEIGGSSFEQLWAIVESKWGQLNSTSEWQNLAERRKAIRMVEAMAAYLSEVEQAEISGVEREKFISGQMHGLEVRGSIDRLEELPDGSLRIVDLKTGNVGTKAEVAENLQLALYQLLAELAYPEKRVSGARIISVKGGKLAKLEQPPLSPEFRDRIAALFDRARAEFPGPSFQAAVSEHCQTPGAICATLLAPEVSVDD